MQQIDKSTSNRDRKKCIPCSRQRHAAIDLFTKTEIHQAYFDEYINLCVKSQRSIFGASVILKQSLLSFLKEVLQNMQPMENFIKSRSVVFLQIVNFCVHFVSGILT